MDDTVKLGGSIELTGFKEMDGGTMVILRKIVGNYVRKLSESSENFELLSITMKKVGNSQFELHGKLMDNGKPYTAEITERNIFVGVDSVLKKLENSLS